MRLGKCVQVTARGGPRGGWGGGGAAASHDQSCSHIIAGVTGAGGKSELTSFQAYEGLGGIHSAYSASSCVLATSRSFSSVEIRKPTPVPPPLGWSPPCRRSSSENPTRAPIPSSRGSAAHPSRCLSTGATGRQRQKGLLSFHWCRIATAIEHTHPRGPQRAFALSVSHSIRVVCGCVGRVMAQLLPRLSPDQCKCGHG